MHDEMRKTQDCSFAHSLFACQISLSCAGERDTSIRLDAYTPVRIRYFPKKRVCRHGLLRKQTCSQFGPTNYPLEITPWDTVDDRYQCFCTYLFSLWASPGVGTLFAWHPPVFADSRKICCRTVSSAKFVTVRVKKSSLIAKKCTQLPCIFTCTAKLNMS